MRTSQWYKKIGKYFEIGLRVSNDGNPRFGKYRRKFVKSPLATHFSGKTTLFLGPLYINRMHRLTK